MSTGAQERKRRGRPSKADAWLTEERISTTALELVDREGMTALSMRRLAHELQVDPMSIYHHVPNKAAVISGMVELVFSRMRLPTADASEWADQVRSWVLAYHDLTLRHPHLVLHIVTDPAAVAKAAAIIDRPLRGVLRGAGVPPDEIDTAIGLLVDYVNGFALAEVSPPHERPKPSPAELERGLDIIILGLRALAAGGPQQS